MFSGNYPITIDEKGRFAIPARFRAELAADCQGQLFIARFGSQIKLFPQPVFDMLSEKIQSEAVSPAEREILRNRFVGSAIRLEMDSQGRLLVPVELREKIIGDAVLVGQIDRFVIWAASEWAAYEAETEERFLAAAAAHGL